MTLVGPVTTGWLLERPNWLLHKFRTGMLTEAVEFWTYSLQFHHTALFLGDKKGRKKCSRITVILSFCYVLK